MKVLFVTSECVPYAKTGGLADVSAALPQALLKEGVEVSVILPRYRGITEEAYDLKVVVENIQVPLSDVTVSCRILSTKTKDGLTVYFVDQPRYFDRAEYYQENGVDYPDNCERFVFFCRAVLEAVRSLGISFDLYHCNDWFTGLVPVYLNSLYSSDVVFKDAASVLTIHNLAYQGVFWHYDMHFTGLGWDLFTYDKLEFFGKLNFLKGGIVFSDMLNTVSETYAQETRTEEYGFGLDALLKFREEDYRGILNGADYDSWNPENDAFIVKKYSEGSIENKRLCKENLQKKFSLPTRSDVPLIGMVSRMASQKGFDLLTSVLDELLEKDIQLVILGEGDSEIEDLLNEAAKQHPEKLGVKVGFKNSLAHKIEAGSDIFLMPSKFEPCGLNQMYSMKYGTVPVVRATGGLADTVEEVDKMKGKGTGFVFHKYDASEMLDALARAIEAFGDRSLWYQIIKNGMACDFSWHQAAKKYIDFYHQAIEKKKK